MMTNTRLMRYSEIAGHKIDFDIHPFECEGLGKPPYTAVDIVGGPGNCQFCNRHLEHQFWFESADKQRFYVGESCAEMAGAYAMVELFERGIVNVPWAKRKLGVRTSEANRILLQIRREILRDQRTAGTLSDSTISFARRALMDAGILSGAA